MQYTVRNVPKAVDQALRRKAKQQRRSLNDIVVAALAQMVGVTPTRVKKRDLSDIAGTYVHDPGFEAALKDQDQIDPEMWQ